MVDCIVFEVKVENLSLEIEKGRTFIILIKVLPFSSLRKNHFLIRSGYFLWLNQFFPSLFIDQGLLYSRK